MQVPNFQPTPNLLKDKKILITGAGSGIGRQVALDAAKMGALFSFAAAILSIVAGKVFKVEKKNG